MNFNVSCVLVFGSFNHKHHAIRTNCLCIFNCVYSTVCTLCVQVTMSVQRSTELPILDNKLDTS